MKDGQPQRTPTRGQSVLLRTSPEGSVDLSPFPGRSVRWLLEDRVETNPVGEFLVWVPLDGGATQRWPYRTFLYEVDKVEIGRAHVCTPVTNAHLVCRLLLDKKKNIATSQQT